MILPIVAYGDPVLRKVGEEIDENYPGLAVLIENMFETMYEASGLGLAAPQVGLPLRLFIIDCSPFAEDEENASDVSHLKGLRKVFINAEIINEQGEEWEFQEGCLSIPDVREPVSRPEKVRLRYRDENFEQHEEEFDGYAARVIQHEYDHIEGILFTDHISPLKRRLLKRKLSDITKGNISIAYKMRFPTPKRMR